MYNTTGKFKQKITHISQLPKDWSSYCVQGQAELMKHVNKSLKRSIYDICYNRNQHVIYQLNNAKNLIDEISAIDLSKKNTNSKINESKQQQQPSQQQDDESELNTIESYKNLVLNLKSKFDIISKYIEYKPTTIEEEEMRTKFNYSNHNSNNEGANAINSQASKLCYQQQSRMFEHNFMVATNYKHKLTKKKSYDKKALTFPINCRVQYKKYGKWVP